MQSEDKKRSQEVRVVLTLSLWSFSLLKKKKKNRKQKTENKKTSKLFTSVDPVNKERYTCTT
jgi:hypothetical protein